MTTEQRLERLERENRWMRRIGAVAVAVAAVVFFIGQGKEKRLPWLEVERLTLKDKSGARRAVLMAAEGWVSLSLFDGGPGLDNRSHLGLTTRADGSSEVSLRGRHFTRALLATNADGTPSLSLFDRRNTVRALLATNADGTPELTLSDENGRSRAVLRGTTTFDDNTGGTKTIGSTLALFDANGKVIWEAPSGRRKALVEFTLARCKRLYNSAMVWKAISRKPPDSLDELVAPMRPGDDVNFLRSVPDDPWDHPYVLKREGTKIRIYSWGEDGKEGTDDDIVYPDK